MIMYDKANSNLQLNVNDCMHAIDTSLEFFYCESQSRHLLHKA